MRPVELSYLGKLESTCPSFDCQQPNLIGSGPTKVSAVNHHQIIRDYIYTNVNPEKAHKSTRILVVETQQNKTIYTGSMNKEVEKITKLITKA